MGKHAYSKEDLLIDSEVSNEIIARFRASRPVVYFCEAESLALAQFIAALELEVAIGQLRDEVLADVAPRYHILRL